MPPFAGGGNPFRGGGDTRSGDARPAETDRYEREYS
jgi:hypothetical protein